MKVKIPYTWKQASAVRFSTDTVRREGKMFRNKRLTCMVDRACEATVAECKEWFKENEVSDYLMFGVFIKHPDEVYYSGLAFEFKDENAAIFFKLSFC